MTTNRFSVTARKLRRIFRFIQKRKIPVKIIYFWTNSLRMDQVRIYRGVIDSFEIKRIDDGYYQEFNIKCRFADGSEMEESIDSWYEFDPYNRDKMKKIQLQFYNSGPCCYFSIERIL